MFCIPIKIYSKIYGDLFISCTRYGKYIDKIVVDNKTYNVVEDNEGTVFAYFIGEEL